MVEAPRWTMSISDDWSLIADWFLISEYTGLGHWGPWQQCQGGNFAVGIRPRVHLLKLQKLQNSRNTRNAAVVNVNDVWISLKHVRELKNERTGLTGLALICEPLYVVESEPWGNFWERIGHNYFSNDADCSNYPANYIRGVRMQYDIDEQQVRHTQPSGDDRPPWRGSSLGTMIFNFAIACTRDFSESVRLENILRFIPNIPGGIKYYHSN